jgi:hypothetical protein
MALTEKTVEQGIRIRALPAPQNLRVDHSINATKTSSPGSFSPGVFAGPWEKSVPG